jgi:Pentapeptide repeats (8 copies)
MAGKLNHPHRMRAAAFGLLAWLVSGNALAQQPATPEPGIAPPMEVLPLAPAPQPADPRPQAAVLGSATGCEGIDIAQPLDAESLRRVQLCEEIKKLQEEVKSLQAAAPWGPWPQILAGGLGGGILALVAALVGWLFQNSLSTVQKQKLRQERFMSLMEGLGAPNLPEQFGSVSALLQRTKELRNASDKKNASEFEMLVKAQVAILRAGKLDPAVIKYLAEGIVDVLQLRKAQDRPAPVFNLKTYGLSNAKLHDVFWADLYAEGVEFFGADLTKASLKQARLAGAVFYQADLKSTVLRNADLSGANFTEAKLDGADLRGAILVGATGLDSAKYLALARWDETTVWPAGFTPPVRG